ncbi:MAG TPA: hypothetical protein PLK90_04245 [Clostridiales bacterium]|nr:hypothetical protein [Clostridiales bacterium]HQP69592.1 hypothetical protein [Clostridiales bacterium]
MNERFSELRTKYPEFIYDSFSKEFSADIIKVKYRFIQSEKIIFEPELSFFLPRKKLSDKNLDTVFFNIGMIELISYYKACCSPLMTVKAGYLNREQKEFWKKLYFNGLGEFLYMNRIETSSDELCRIVCDSGKVHAKSDANLTDGCLIPVGGGKDSVVTLEILKELDCLPLILNPREASVQTVQNSGYRNFFKIERKIDPKLLELNKAGYLNGHTPFSALLAFVSATAGLMTGRKNIVLSNENSASIGNVMFSGIEINHQYSKSFEAEKDLNDYIAEYIHSEINYFSFLRPLNELKIAELFSRYDRHRSTFRSCNAGSKNNIWCGKCPKCLFTYIILSPFIDRIDLVSIFGSDLLTDTALEKTFDELTGEAGIKPFECVGTKEEVNAALAFTLKKYGNEKLPYLLDIFYNRNSLNINKFLKEFNAILNEFNNMNLLDDHFKKILTDNL